MTAGISAVTIPIVIGITNPPQIRAQTQGFEVASVKANKSTDPRSMRMQSLPGGTLILTGVPLRLIITEAYSLPFNVSERLSGGPDWSENYDIEAKAAPDAIPAGLSEKSRNDKLMLMLQALLADRFKLKIHWETKELPVYALVVSKKMVSRYRKA